MLKRTSQFGRLPPNVGLHFYDSLVKPILLYGSDVWGVSMKGHKIIESCHLQFLRMNLNIKQSTCKMMIYGDLGRIPLYYHAVINVLKYWKRLKSLPENKIVKKFITVYMTCTV